MIVDRMSVKAKSGAQVELASFMKDWCEKLGWRGRVYTSLCGGGETNRVIVEVEHENMAAWEQADEKLRLRADTAAMFTRLSELTENEGTREFLQLR
jgi:hypothetical protein